jgi:multidrug efflux pump subunit AcrA (membrane-fusion protein)
VARGNEAIGRLQSDLAAAKKLSKEKSHVLREQEKTVEAERARAAAAVAEAHRLGLEERRAQEDGSRTEAELAEARRRLAESADLLESNQQTIAWCETPIFFCGFHCVCMEVLLHFFSFSSPPLSQVSWCLTAIAAASPG